MNKENAILNKEKEDYRTKEQRAVLRAKNKKQDPNGGNYNTSYDA